jgi:thymidylate kinase
LHEDGPAIRTVGGARLVVAICDDADPNAIVAAARRDGTWAVAYARDPSRAAGAWHGFVPPAALYGTDAGNRVREIWRRYWAERGQAGAVRHAVLGLDPDLERRLAEPAGVAPTARRARIFAVTGLDGAGKSTHAAALRAALEARGRRSRILKLYRQGAFLALADELSGRTRRGAPLAAFRVSRIVKLVDSLRVYRDQLRPALDSLDAVVLDRYTETHRAAAAAQLGWDLTQHPALALFPPADRAFWLRLDVDEAVRRLHARGGRLTADEHTVGLAGYAEAFRLMTTPAAATPADVVLEADAPFAANAARIANEALTVVAPPAAGAMRATTASPIAPAAAERARTHALPVDIGGAADGAVLGSEIAELAAMLRDRLGRAADGVTAAFWVEAYAAQLVLDARCAIAPNATIALWPAALRRMPLFANLVALDDLSRLLDAAVSVRSFTLASPAADALWTVIAPSPTARARLAAEYRDAVAAIAGERAWPHARAARLDAHVCAPKTSAVGVSEPIVDETLTCAQ